jgi:aminoglycoside phosphotransferase (APT) family kinase protein
MEKLIASQRMICLAKNNELVASCARGLGISNEEAEANAEFIVTACNAYEQNQKTILEHQQAAFRFGQIAGEQQKTIDELVAALNDIRAIVGGNVSYGEHAVGANDAKRYGDMLDDIKKVTVQALAKAKGE